MSPEAKRLIGNELAKISDSFKPREDDWVSSSEVKYDDSISSDSGELSSDLKLKEGQKQHANVVVFNAADKLPQPVPKMENEI